MPLGRIDFQNIPSYEPVAPGNYDGFTDSWEAKLTKNGDSTNIEAKFKFNHLDSDGNEAQRTIFSRYNMKPGALWGLRKALVDMGADPSEFGESTDLEDILNRVFGSVPTPVTLTLTQKEYPEGSGQYRNEVAAVKLREV